jgi:hypothetical protein
MKHVAEYANPIGLFSTRTASVDQNPFHVNAGIYAEQDKTEPSESPRPENCARFTLTKRGCDPSGTGESLLENRIECLLSDLRIQALQTSLSRVWRVIE